jgi:ribosomal protein S12 methylthiotransferase accessory factor
VLEQLERAEIDPVILWRPTEIGVPVAEAYIVDRRERMGIYKGYGCHLDPEVAIVRAVTEAVQGRTIFVAGARDDMLTSSYEAMKRSDVFTPDQHRGNARTVSIDDVPNRATGTFHGDIAVLIELLRGAGFDRVLVRELDASAFESSVARVLVPELEGYRFPWARPSRRADAFRPPQI